VNRVDELTLRLLDDPGTPAERTELTRLLDRDPRSLRKHLALMEIELALRAGMRPPDVTASVMEAVRASARARRPLRAMPRLPTPRHAPVRRHRLLHVPTRWRMWLLWMLLLGSVVTGALVGAHVRHPSGLPAASAPMATRVGGGGLRPP
jgi:hypothetical protein